MSRSALMNATRCGRVIALAILAMAATPAGAQFTPNVGYVYPAGGQQATSFEISIGGQRLREAKSITISGQGVEGEVVEYIEPDGRKVQKLRARVNKLEAAQQKADPQKARAADEDPEPDVDSKADTVEIRQLRKQIRQINRRRFNPKTQVSRQIGETIRVKLTIAADAAPGKRELRVVGPTGASNPLVFHVGQLSEVVEGAEDAPSSPLTELPAVLNGQVMAGQEDRYSIRARRGQKLVLATDARSLMPYLADAVPGWFQAVVTLTDADGKEVAYVDDYRFDPDPVMFYDVPADGVYTLAIRDSIYRGRPDFVYRISIGELPFVRSIFPLGGAAGEATTVTIEGWNLPTDRVEVDATGDKPGLRPLAVSVDGATSNSVPFMVSDLPELLEVEPNNDAPNAQSVALPVMVNGRIDSPGDWDVFEFEGKAGQRIVAETYARRLGSPLDATLTLTDSEGRELAANDDRKDIASGLITHHADSYLSIVLPADGRYLLRVGDIQGHGSSHHAYRLRIGTAQPDFAVRIVPSAIRIPRGGIAPLTVHVLRKDGFSGEIRLAMKDMPEALAISGVIPANEDKVHLTMTASKDVALGRMTPQLEAVATIDGKTFRHDVVPADEMMQAFLYRHLVPAQELIVAVAKPARVSLKADLPAGKSLKIPAGGTVELLITGNRRAGGARQFKLALADAPEGIAVEDVAIEAGNTGAVLVVRADAEHLKPGRKGNLIVALMAGKNRRRICIAPAIPFEIVE